MMSLWDALRMNMMISYQELVRTFPKPCPVTIGGRNEMPHVGAFLLVGGVNNKTRNEINFGGYLVFDDRAIIIFALIYRCDNCIR